MVRSEGHVGDDEGVGGTAASGNGAGVMDHFVEGELGCGRVA